MFSACGAYVGDVLGGTCHKKLNHHQFFFFQKAESFLTWDMVIRFWEGDISGHLHRTKLTYDHIYLTAQSKMKVKLASQVCLINRSFQKDALKPTILRFTLIIFCEIDVIIYGMDDYSLTSRHFVFP